MSATPFAQLQSFLVVARLRSFSRAARELGVSRSAVSQAVRQLEEQLQVVLLIRTTRSVALTDAGRRLSEAAAPALSQVVAALTDVTARPGEVGGRVRLSVPRAALLVINPLLRAFRAVHPRIEVDVVVEDRLVDIVAEGYDAGVRLSEVLARDMVSVRITEPFRFVVVGAPSYLARHGTPAKPEDLLRHDCVNFRLPTSGAPYAWELERGRRTWRLAVRGAVTSNDGTATLLMAAEGLGLAYGFEPTALPLIRAGRLVRVLEPYAPMVPGFFLYYPSRAQSSPALRLFAAVARDRLARRRRSARSAAD